MEYVGHWHEGKMCGLGKRTITKGKGKNVLKHVYEGEFHNDLPNGFGKFKEKMGKYTMEFYNGYWSNDKPHGKGKQIL